MGSAIHGEAAKTRKSLTFYANNTVGTLYLCEYSGDFDDKWTSLKPLIFLTLTLCYFFRKGHFKGFYLPLKYDAVGVTIGFSSDQQGDTFFTSTLKEITAVE